jgi:MFS family permease
MFGTAVTLIVLLLHAREFGAFAVVAILIAEFVPVTVGAPLAGLLVDRVRNRRLMVVGQVVQAVAVIGLVGVLPVFSLVLLMLVLLGCGTAVVNPAAAAMVPVICGEDESARGYAAIATGRTLGMLVGSAVGGLLVAWFGTRGALCVDAATYLVQAGLLTLVRTERDPRGACTRPSRGEAMAGMRHLVADPVLRVAVLSLAVAMTGVMAADVATVFYATEVLRGGAVILGILHASWLLGAFVGARLSICIRSDRLLLTGLASSCCVMGAAMLVPAMLPFVASVASGYLLGGVANGVQTVSYQRLVRVRSPGEMRGRVFAAAGAVLIGSNVLGTILGGVVVALAGARWSFAIAGTASLVSGGVALAVLRTVDMTKPASVT